MGELLAKKPSILIMSICSLYHIFYVGISDIACNEFTKRSTRSTAIDLDTHTPLGDHLFMYPHRHALLGPW
jgi:hypothetical protein